MCDTLIAINDCAIFDRHRKLHIVGGYVTDSSSFVQVTPPAEVINQKAVTAGDYFKGEFVVAEFTVEGWTPDTQIRGEGNFQITVEVDQIPRVLGNFVGDRLKTMINNTRFIIQEFEKYLP